MHQSIPQRAVRARAEPTRVRPARTREARPMPRHLRQLSTGERYVRQYILGLDQEINVDLFAGGGGASTGMEAALGRHVDIAINHDRDAIAMHAVNHPQAKHYQASVWEVNPRLVCEGRPVGYLHASPDCTHHSQAKGGQPRSEQRRSLAWVVRWWAGTVQPRVITLENVNQLVHWGPLVAKRDPSTGRVVKIDGSIAAPGERVRRQDQFLVPCAKRIGRTWQHFVSVLRAMGYVVEWRSLSAADVGTPTIRERLFMVARRDGVPITWPRQTHASAKQLAKAPNKDLKQHVGAHTIIDWSIPVPSIFGRDRPLVDATCRRIAVGVDRFVVNNPSPFLVQITRGPGSGATKRWGTGCRGIEEPMPTLTGQAEYALAVPTLIQVSYGERKGQAPRVLDLQAPLGTIVAGGGKHALVAAFMAQHNAGFMGDAPGHDLRKPVSTITSKGSQQQLVAVELAHLPDLTDEQAAGAERVAAFLMRYYGTGGQYTNLLEPMATITTKARMALVLVHIDGKGMVITDIGMRMLEPHELYAAQGFPAGYIFDRGADGKPLTKTAMIRMVGNSVCPRLMQALYESLLSAEPQPFQMAA